MDYADIENRLLLLKRNYKKKNSKETFKELMKIIGMHPDALTIISDLNLVDPDQLSVLRASGCTGRALAHALLNQMKLTTSNSTELSIKTFGYNKVITPSNMNHYIDIVITRVQMQKEQTEKTNRLFNSQLDDMVQEEETTLSELEQFH